VVAALAAIVTLAKAAAAGLVVPMELMAAEVLFLVPAVFTAVAVLVVSVVPETAQAAQFASFGPERLGNFHLQTRASCNSRCLAHRFLSGTINRTGPMTRFS
jgi:hypothetical protein